MKSQRGIAAVEFALVLPILVLLAFGIIEFSLALYDKAVITNASREGARAGIVAQSPKVKDAEIKAAVINYCNPHLITFRTDQTIKGTDITIVPPDSRDGMPFGTDLTVTVTYRYDFLVFPGLTRLMGGSLGPIDLVARTTMKME